MLSRCSFAESISNFSFPPLRHSFSDCLPSVQHTVCSPFFLKKLSILQRER